MVGALLDLLTFLSIMYSKDKITYYYFDYLMNLLCFNVSGEWYKNIECMNYFNLFKFNFMFL